MSNVAQAIRFDVSNKMRALEEIVSEGSPNRLRISFEGPVKELNGEVILRLAGGRLAEATSKKLSGARALMRLVLAEQGTIEVTPDNDSAPAATRPVYGAVLAEAEANTRALLSLLKPVGGFAAVLKANLDQLVNKLAEIPDAANDVLRLCDGVRNVAAILNEASYDEVLTARILQRLFVAEILIFATAMPEPVEESEIIAEGLPDSDQKLATGWDEESALPSPDEIGGELIAEDIKRWLETESAPESFLSEDAFTEAFVQETAKPGTASEAPEVPAGAPPAAGQVRDTMPFTTTPPTDEQWDPLPSHTGPLETEDDPDVLADAGVLKKDDSNSWAIGALLIVVVVGLIIFAVSQEDSDSQTTTKADVGSSWGTAPPPDKAKTTTTSTGGISTAEIVELTGRPPPIAGPDAPEDVRKAESLLNAGAFSEAQELLAVLRRSREQDPDVWVLSGQLFVDTGKLFLAKGMADRATRIEPKHYRAWVLTGTVHQFRGSPWDALQAYERALSIDPNHVMSSELRSVIEELKRRRLNR